MAHFDFQQAKWEYAKMEITPVNSFFDQGEFEAMKTLSDHRAPRCDKHQFHANMTVST